MFNVATTTKDMLGRFNFEAPESTIRTILPQHIPYMELLYRQKFILKKHSHENKDVSRN